jgi:hypothetical protein
VCHAVLAVKAVRAALRAVLRESAAPSLDGSAAAWGSRPRGQFRPLKRISTMAHTLFIRDGETFREAPAQDIIDRAAALIAQRFRSGSPALQSPHRTRQYLRHQIGALPYEVFGLLLLDNRHRLIRAEVLFRGTIDGASVHPREVARVVLEANAAAVILVHFVACNKMRLMCPGSFCAQLSEGFVVERDFVRRRHITTGSS